MGYASRERMRQEHAAYAEGYRDSAKRSGSSIGVVIAIAFVLGWAGNSTVTTDGTTAVDTCTDGIDNDNDGNADSNDPECLAGSPVYDGDENDPFDGQGPP